jgi:hypothetical protein
LPFKTDLMKFAREEWARRLAREEIPAAPNDEEQEPFVIEGLGWDWDSWDGRPDDDDDSFAEFFS